MKSVLIILVFALCVSRNEAAIGNKAEVCNQLLCAPINAPICARDPDTNRETNFPNMCSFTQHNLCTGDILSYFHEGACCDKITYQPIISKVCVRDSGTHWETTLDSMCDLEREICRGRNLEFVHIGECCDNMCPPVMQLICVWDPINYRPLTLQNKCILRLYICRTGQDFILLHEGSCRM